MDSGEAYSPGSGSPVKGTKTVTFHPNSIPPEGGHDGRQPPYYSDPMWGSRESSSGYVAEDGADQLDEGIRHSYYTRLLRFYSKYNPGKQHKVEEYLNAYKGEEEQLFAIVVAKYGPEPVDDDDVVGTMESRLSSEAEAPVHFTGKRCKFPTIVGPADGKTDCETPYWAGITSLISERDLLSLLQNLKTENTELQKCYMGMFADHPMDSWNGMTYISESERVAIQGTLFLGHLWVGTLGSGKVLFHKKAQYHRTTLYCTEECQRSGNHERWRLSVYRSELSPLVLLRTLWDPVVIPEPLPLSRSNLSEREFHSSSESLPSASSRRSSSDVGQKILQPTAPAISVAVNHFTQVVSDLEKKLLMRLDKLETRAETIERKLQSS